MPTTVVVVPCYNEEARFDSAEFTRLAAIDGVGLLLVDDGSTDRTREVLGALARTSPERIEVLSLDRNRGKAEAVRQGLQRAIARGATSVGFVDADLATPVDEIGRLIGELEVHTSTQVVLAARVALAGRAIRRRAIRHYAGRVFSSGASVVLRAVVYDTQCGAKFFRATSSLLAALDTPFLSRWAFDVELLGRLLIGTPEVDPVPAQAILEVPLLRWDDVAGSKVSVQAMVRTGLELVRIERDLGRRRSRMARRDP